jgi:uncharacterized protein (DUF58 family)
MRTFLRRPRPLQAIQQRVDAWVLRRVRRSTEPVTVPRQRVYILPTRFGYGFGLLSFVMLLGSMNYTNSMGFALTFMLGALGLVAMHHTHANLAGVEVRGGGDAPVFAGDPARFELQLRANGRQPHFSVEAGWPRQVHSTPTDVTPEADARLSLTLPTHQRGWLEAPPFSIASTFPMGLFRAWTYLALTHRVLVYPAPTAAGGPPPPFTAPAHSGMQGDGRSGQDQFAGLRGYQRGDALNTIHWKSLPKLPQPVVKQFEDPRAPECWLRLQDTPGQDLEQRLSQLTRWVLDLEAQGSRYGLQLPDVEVPMGAGEHHLHRCLAALALHGRDGHTA